MGKKDDNIKAIKRDDRNLNIAGKRWEEAANIEDTAVNLLSQIREDVEHDE